VSHFPPLVFRSFFLNSTLKKDASVACRVHKRLQLVGKYCNAVLVFIIAGDPLTILLWYTIYYNHGWNINGYYWYINGIQITDIASSTINNTINNREFLPDLGLISLNNSNLWHPDSPLPPAAPPQDVPNLRGNPPKSANFLWSPVEMALLEKVVDYTFCMFTLKWWRNLQPQQDRSKILLS
jgi:hypothetical protein